MNITYSNTITVDDYNMLRAAVSWNSCKPERVRMALERSDFLTVARDGDQTVGMARVIHDGLQALVIDVIVTPEYQGHGIGKSMMKDLMAYIEALSCGGGIYVNLMTAPDKVGFYEQFGFVKRPHEQRGPDMAKWVEVKEATL